MFGLSQKQILYIVVAVLVLGAVVFFVFQPRVRAIVDLDASSDKQSYTTDEEINLSISLNNLGKVETCLSDLGSGSIKFTSFTRDGEPVGTRSVPANYIESFSKLLEISLEPIDPGEELSIMLSSENDPGLGARALTTTTLEKDTDTGIVTFYNVEEPGEYSLEISYEYLGPKSSDCRRVFGGPTNTANITFAVTQ